MKKILAVVAMASTPVVWAANWASVDVEKVKNQAAGSDSVAQYLRISRDIGSANLFVQGRTARFDQGGLVNSVEVSASDRRISALGVTPFVGVGHDSGFNGGPNYNYGLLGANWGQQIGPGYALLGVKTRVGSTEPVARTRQTVSYASYSVPVTKVLAVNFNVSRSDQTIQEHAYGMGVQFRF